MQAGGGGSGPTRSASAGQPEAELIPRLPGFLRIDDCAPGPGGQVFPLGVSSGNSPRAWRSLLFYRPFPPPSRRHARDLVIFSPRIPLTAPRAGAAQLMISCQL